MKDFLRTHRTDVIYASMHCLKKIGAIAEKNEIAYVAEGSNMDDLGDYRPGLQAVAELGVKVHCARQDLQKRRFVNCQKRWDFQPGKSHLLLV